MSMKLAALGGPNTFGGDAARLMRESYPEFTEIVYFRTAEEGFDFAKNGADAMCAPQQMSFSGFHVGINAKVAVPESKLYVIGDVTHEYHCSLLVKPRTRLDQIRRVLGHTGSVTQSRRWLKQHVPQAEIEIVHTSSMGAAQEVAEGDGSIASVGTPGMAQQYHLEEIGRDIDGGSVGNYWALSARPLFSEAPTRLVMAGRLQDDGALSDVIDALAQTGFRLHTVYAQPSTRRLYEYDYVLRLGGAGALTTVRAAIVRFPSVRLAGAYEARA